MGRRLIVTIDLDTSAVEDFGGEGEMVYHILEELMYKMSQETKVTSRDVLDVNGNRAGHAEVVDTVGDGVRFCPSGHTFNIDDPESFIPDGEPGERICPECHETTT